MSFVKMGFARSSSRTQSLFLNDQTGKVCAAELAVSALKQFRKTVAVDSTRVADHEIPK
jgi:hypothetical protein